MGLVLNKKLYLFLQFPFGSPGTDIIFASTHKKFNPNEPITYSLTANMITWQRFQGDFSTAEMVIGTFTQWFRERPSRNSILQST